MNKIVLNITLIVLGVIFFGLNVIIDGARVGAPNIGLVIVNMGLITSSFFLISLGVINFFNFKTELKWGMSVVLTVILWILFVNLAFYFGS